MSVFFCIIRTFYILVMRIFCMIFCYVLPFTLRSTIYVEFLMVWDESISFFSLYDYNYWGTTTYWKDHSPPLCSYFCHILAGCVDTGICLGSPVPFFCLSLCQCTTVFKYSASSSGTASGSWDPFTRSLRTWDYCHSKTRVLFALFTLILSWVCRGCVTYDSETDWIQKQLKESCYHLLSQILKKVTKM